MSKQQPPANSNLEQILADLEQKFGVSSSSDEKNSGQNNKKKAATKLSRQTLLSLVALVVIVAGAAASYLLVQQSQEIRQQASVPYPSCGIGSLSPCSPGTATGSSCTINGQPGTCQNSDTSAVCSCQPNAACVPVNGDCSGGQVCCSGSVCIAGTCIATESCPNGPGTCDTTLCAGGFCHLANSPACELLGTPGQYETHQTLPSVCGSGTNNQACCPVGVTNPTRTPTPRPSATPVIVQPTNTPGSGGGNTPVPTQPPANTPRPTNTPTRAPSGTPNPPTTSKAIIVLMTFLGTVAGD